MPLLCLSYWHCVSDGLVLCPPNVVITCFSIHHYRLLWLWSEEGGVTMVEIKTVRKRQPKKKKVLLYISSLGGDMSEVIEWCSVPEMLSGESQNCPDVPLPTSVIRGPCTINMYLNCMCLVPACFLPLLHCRENVFAVCCMANLGASHDCIPGRRWVRYPCSNAWVYVQLHAPGWALVSLCWLKEMVSDRVASGRRWGSPQH